MAIGLFPTFAPPGVYTQTLLDNALPTLFGGLKIPVLVGPAEESKTVTDEQLFRGSSSSADNPVYGEDLSEQALGTNRGFQVSRFPVVDGNGTGTVTNDPRKINVYVNDTAVVVLTLDGATGYFELQSIPSAGDSVRVDYFFKRSDTLVEEEDVSAQFGATPVSVNTFQTRNFPLVNGLGGGIITTDPVDVTVTVNGFAATVVAVDGLNGLVTLETTPAAGSTVLVTYWYNMYRDTSDSLRYPGVTRILNVGTSPGRSDFTDGIDFTLFEDEIHWGSVAKVSTGTTALGTTPLSSAQVFTSLVDDRVYLEQASGLVNSSNRTFTLEFTPVDGTGVGRETNDPDKVVAYVGTSAHAAYLAGPVTVSRVTGALKSVDIDYAPVGSELVFVTYYRSRLTDGEFTLTSTVKGGAGVGKYTIHSVNHSADLALVEEGNHVVANPNFALEGIRWPNDQPDIFTAPGYAVNETVTVTFFSAWEYSVTSSNPGGSGGLGALDQTYEDTTTGLTFTILSPLVSTYQGGDVLKFEVTVGGAFTAGSAPVMAIPGVRLTVLDLVNVCAGNTAHVYTFKATGSEPAIGDYYYVSYEFERTDYSTKVYTDFKLVKAEYGALEVSNPLVLAGYLAYAQSAVAVGFKQVPRATSSDNASAQTYLLAFEELEVPFAGGFTADIIVPLTTDTTVFDGLRQHCETQSGAMFQNECMCIVGVASGTTPAQAKAIAESLRSKRAILVYPDAAILSLEDAAGVEIEYVVDGTMVAAAYAGLWVNPNYDVAEPMTRKKLTGFKRLARQLTVPEQNQIMVAGVTVFRDLATSLQVIMSVSTDMTSVLTRSPNITRTSDQVQQTTRVILDQFIGQKFLKSVLGDVEAATGAMLNSFVENKIIAEYRAIEAQQDTVDPQILRLTFSYLPIFALNWIDAKIQLQSRFN